MLVDKIRNDDIDTLIVKIVDDIDYCRENKVNTEYKKYSRDEILEMQVEFYEMGRNKEMPTEWENYKNTKVNDSNDTDNEKVLEFKRIL